MQLDERLLLLLDDARLPHRHRRRVVVVERPAGREHEGVLGVRLLDRRAVLDGEEAAAASGQRGGGRVEVRRAGVVPVDARPLQPDILEAVVANPRPVRRQVGELVPDVLGRRVLPVGAEPPREVDDDPPVLASVPR